MQVRGTVLIVDHDPDFLESADKLLLVHGYSVRTFSSVKSLLAYPLPSTPCCAIIDAEMPGFASRDLYRVVNIRRPDVPIIQLTQHGSVPQAVQAIRDGAVDFLTKPVEDKALVYAVQRAFVEEERLRPQHEQCALFEQRFATLTEREKEVCALVIAGKLNKQIAFQLGTCEKTVKVHRGRVMRKLSVESVAELVRFALTAADGAPAGRELLNGQPAAPSALGGNSPFKALPRQSGFAGIAALFPVLGYTENPPRQTPVAA